MLAEVKDPAGKVYFGLEIDLPDGTTLRYANSFLMTSSGTYKGALMEWGEIPKTVSRWDSSLETYTITVGIADKDREISKLLGGKFEGRLEGSAARVKMISPNVAAADWYTAFAGKFQHWGAAGAMPTITMTLGLNDKLLQSAAKLGRITNAVFTSAGPDVIDLPIPAVYGSHARPAGGAVNAYRISATEWLVSAGFVEDIPQVYEDGAISTGSWSYQQSTRRGRYFSEILFTADPGDVAITCDVEGLTASGDGTGSAITNPADILEHMLANWYFNAYEMGTYYTAGTTEVNSTYVGVVADWMDTYSWTAKKVITEDLTGYQLVNEWAGAWRVPVFWTSAGALGMAVDEHYTWKASQDTLNQSHLLSESITENRDDALADEVTIQHGYFDADGSTTDESKATDKSRSFDTAREIDNAWNSD